MTTESDFTTEISDTNAQTRTIVRVGFTSDQTIPAGYTRHQMVPFHAELTYAYTSVRTGDGWTEHQWVCKKAEVTGHRVLAPGPGGEQRVSDKAMHVSTYVPVYTDDLANWSKTPPFLADLVELARPSGEIRVLAV